MLNHRNHPEERWTYSSASGNLLYTYENLTAEDLDFTKSWIFREFTKKKGIPFSVIVMDL